MSDGSNNNMTSFPKKLLDCLSDEFKDGAPGMSTEDLRKKLVEFERGVSETEKDMKNDPKLLQLKEDLKAYSEGYKDLIKENKASIQYVLYILEMRGAS
jgi:hypothetical protein